jgi:hypothetical protein
MKKPKATSLKPTFALVWQVILRSISKHLIWMWTWSTWSAR